MTQGLHILLLGGSSEARLLAETLSALEIAYTVWLSEAPRGPAPLPQVPQLRRFPDVAAMQDEMAQGGFTAVLDASHVFDPATTEQGYSAACALGLPYLRIERPAWNINAYPRWKSVPSVSQANTCIGKGARVFCATGWDSLPEYSGFLGDVLMLRQTRRHDRAVSSPYVELVFGDPPFDAASEVALFEKLGVDLLVCRNLGGTGSWPKLEAADVLGLDVILIDRPAVTDGLHVVDRVEAALSWLDALRQC